MVPLETFSPALSYEEALRRASDLWGVQAGFWDIWGNRHLASAEMQKAVLRSLHVDAESRESLNAALEQRAWNEWSVLSPSTLVLSLSSGVAPICLPLVPTEANLCVEFEWEDGHRDHVSYPVADLRSDGEAAFRDRRFVRKLLPIPPSAALGYHRLRLQYHDLRSEIRLILCPDRAYQPAFLEQGRKAAGVAVSLYGLRSERNWGCGDITDLRSLTDWIASDVKASFIALNPLHAIPNRQPYNTSPYLPNCSYYRNCLYIDVEAVEDLQRSVCAKKLLSSPKLQKQLADLRASEFVEYEKVYRLKLRVLKLAFRVFLREYGLGSARALEFRHYAEAEGDLLDRFALYCALEEVLHKRDRNLWIWPDWPDHYKDLSSPEIDQFRQEYSRLILFYKYIQWQLDWQLSQAHAYARQQGLSIGLYHDLALATDRCGSDLWAHGEFYISGCRVGSPPDGFSPEGQDWAFPPPNSIHHRENGYHLFAESIRKNLKHGGALRIDHVMRFFRLFWIPEGKDATDGLYVREFSEDLLRILALESVRHKVVIIGEDLGTVEPYIREALHNFGVLSYRLLYFERHEDGSFKRPEEYPVQSLVSVSTHDLPTLAGFWENRDIEARRKAGVVGDEASYQRQLQERAADKQKLLDLFASLNLLSARSAGEIQHFSGELHNAAIGFLASTPSALMVLNQEDLFKEMDQQNLPGTTEQYPNWRHKMHYSLEELRADPTARNHVRMFRDWLDRTGRSQS